MKQIRKPVAVDLFSGAGGFSQGLSEAGYDVAYAFDYDQRHVDAHQRAHPDCVSRRWDLNEVDNGIVNHMGKGRIDVVVGGPPCQGFSRQGRQDPSDKRRKLIQSFGDWVYAICSHAFVMENVVGILDKGAEPDLKLFYDTMTRRGYKVLEPKKILATECGVPQTRERVFIVGVAVGGAFDVPDWSTFYCENFYMTPRQLLARVKPGKLTKHRPDVIERFKATPIGKRERISKFFKIDPDRPIPTLTAGTRWGSSKGGAHTAKKLIHWDGTRTLSVRETAVLQGFPANYPFDETMHLGLLQIGNSVCPPVARAVGYWLRNYLRN